jgi:methylglutaconyl-CoA hydratase
MLRHLTAPITRTATRRFLSVAPTVSSSVEVSPVRLTRSTTLEGLSYLSLNRPQAKNALSVELVDRAREAVEQVRFDG